MNINDEKKSCFLVTFKRGLGEPIHVYATDFKMATNEAMAYYKKNSGLYETVDMYSTAANTIEKVELVEA